ncbi:MAG: carbohydrate ABC transporter permease, partial [Clostridia bacterium]|nr:carbohydrate ABC transporter permease [Clostridia bacterium]
TMYISGGMVPSYLLVYETLNMKDSLWAIIIPSAITTHNLIVLRTNFQSIPDSLEEAAKIDGANDLVVLTKIILPLSKAAIAVMVLFYGVSRWNGWFNAMLYLRSRDKFPLQLILREILISNSTDSMESYGDSFSGVSESIKYATIIVATVPILVVYPFIQKYFVKGTMVGAVKG